MDTETIRILITGDFCPINRVEKLALKSDYYSVYNDFIDVFKGNNLNVTDLECPLTTSVHKRKKTGPHQKANPGCIGLLEYADINLAVLANNHIMDYGSEGLVQTIEICQHSEIQVTGINSNEARNTIPFLTEISGKRICFINIADHEFLSAPDGLYQANAINAVKNYYDIKNIRNQCDYLIVIAHGGNEFYSLPSPRIKTLYRFFIDAGADAVVSHHTHCFSGFEIYKNKPVFYGLGNFIYDWPGKVNTDWNKGYVVRLLLSDKISFEIIPLKQCNESPGVFHLEGIEDRAFWNTLEERNRIIGDESELEQAFKGYTERIKPIYDAFIEPYFGKIYNALRQRGFLPNLLNKKKRLLLLNLARCESHREVLLRMLTEYEQD